MSCCFSGALAGAPDLLYVAEYQGVIGQGGLGDCWKQAAGVIMANCLAVKIIIIIFVTGK